MRELNSEEADEEDLIDNLRNDLDLIIKHDKVKDIIVEKNLFTVFTNPLYIYSDRGRKYYGGNFTIKININNTSIKFNSDNKRQSYWTNNDPHPHVNGADGSACLGNVASTIAELCSQVQLYPLVLICIDFLESANTEDSAGKNIRNWQEVDNDNNPIKVEQEYYCDECGKVYPHLFKKCIF